MFYPLNNCKKSQHNYRNKTKKSLTSMVSPQKNWQEQQEQLSQNPLNRKDKQELFKMRNAKKLSSQSQQ